MKKYIWLLVFALPMWAAVKFDAPKWVLMLTSVPFYVRAATLGNDPEVHLLGEGFSQYRPLILIVLGILGLILGVSLLMVVRSVL